MPPGAGSRPPGSLNQPAGEIDWEQHYPPHPDLGDDAPWWKKTIRNIILPILPGSVRNRIEPLLRENQDLNEVLNLRNPLKPLQDFDNASSEKLEKLEKEAMDYIVSDIAKMTIRASAFSLINTYRKKVPDRPLSENKIKITKSKLIDLISEQVKEQTQTVDVTKDQLVALVAQEAYKQISRKK